MKQFNTIILLFIGFYNLQSQLIKAPNINFGGSKVDWVHTAKDTFETDQISQSFPSFSNKEIGVIRTRPKEFDNKIIFNVSNYNTNFLGTMLAAFELESGNEVWSKNFNPHFENNYGYGYSLEMVLNKDKNLVISGFRSKVPFIGSWWSGHYTQRLIDINNGNTLANYNNTRQDLRIVSTNPAQVSEEGPFFVYNAFFGVPNQPYNVRFFPVKIDVANDTIIDNIEFDPETNITFLTKNEEQTTFRIDGPFTRDNVIFTFLIQYEKEGKPVQWLWKTDQDAKVLEKRELSSNFGEYYFEAEQKDSLIELITLTRDGVFQGHRGYILMDMDGNIVNRNSQITIEGKKAGHLSTTRLKGRDEVLHVIRFQNDNDIYVYRETKDKQYIKSAHLVNPNSSAYAFIPRYIFQSSDDGLVISGSFLMDTLLNPNSLRCNFDCGGWPVIMKLSAETLGIPTSTSDVWLDEISYSITPNPSSHQITITIPEINNAVTLHITDQMGRSVWVQDIYDTETGIDISSLASGMYFVSLVDASSGRQLGKVQKLVKVE